MVIASDKASTKGDRIRNGGIAMESLKGDDVTIGNHDAIGHSYRIGLPYLEP